MYPSRSYQTSSESPLESSLLGSATRGGSAARGNAARQLTASQGTVSNGSASQLTGHVAKLRAPSKVIRGRVLTQIVPKNDAEAIFQARPHRATVHEIYSLNAKRGQPAIANLPYGSFKAAFDLVGAMALLTATAPIMAATAIAIKITSPGPVIFRQRRLTQLGKEFTIYKFRTMHVDAEATSGAVWAEKNDPRVTRLGSFLRLTRLDELPQLFNVLKGDMSLIGPRPERPEFVETLSNELPGFHRRLQVKAGLTGLAQVGSGYSSSLEGHRKKLAYDRLYISKRSIWLDLWITAKTIGVVITGRGAR